jgi:uncharacterized RDD family membrane protein YckC
MAPPGCLALGLKIAGLDGKALSPSMSLLRFVIQFSSVFAFPPAGLFSLYNILRGRRALHDMAAGSMVFMPSRTT